MPGRGGVFLPGIAPDGYAPAQIDDLLVSISNNIFSFPTAPATTVGKVLVLDGPAGRREVAL